MWWEYPTKYQENMHDSLRYAFLRILVKRRLYIFCNIISGNGDKQWKACHKILDYDNSFWQAKAKACDKRKQWKTCYQNTGLWQKLQDLISQCPIIITLSEFVIPNRKYICFINMSFHSYYLGPLTYYVGKVVVSAQDNLYIVIWISVIIIWLWPPR